MKQIKLNKNLTEVYINDNIKILFSYEKPVAVLNTEVKTIFGMPWQVNTVKRTKTKYSKTTTKHINKWINDNRVGLVVFVDKLNVNDLMGV